MTTYVVNNVNEYASSTTTGLGTTTYQYDANGNLIGTIDPQRQPHNLHLQPTQRVDRGERAGTGRLVFLRSVWAR